MKRILICVLSVLLLSGPSLFPVEAQVKIENKITINNKEIPKDCLLYASEAETVESDRQ